MPEIFAELRLRPMRASLILTATAIWSVWTIVTVHGQTDLPAPVVVIVGIPIVLLRMLLIPHERDRLLHACVALVVLLLAAVGMEELITASPILAMAPFAIVGSAALCSKFPAGTAIVLFALTGFYGSILAFTGIPGTVASDLLLGGMWTGLLLARLAGGRTRVRLVWPAMLIVGAYIAVTVADVVSAESIAPAFLSFRLSTWYLLAVVLLAYVGWSPRTYTRVARGAVVVGGLVGAYATLRWFIGPAASEYQFALQVGGAFNFVDGELRTFGSFGSGHQLGFWAGVVAPFCLAAALGWRGGWRWIAALAFAALVFAVLASEVRGAFIGLVLGVGLVLLLVQFASSTPTLDLGRVLLVGVTCLGVVTGTLLFTAGGEGGLERYDAILDPSNDPAYLRREQKLAAAIPEINEQPLGHGLGSASLNRSLRPPHRTVATYSLDNSFLRIAYEQGWLVVLLFAIALAALLLRLSTGSLRTGSREAGTMGIGAAGALVSTAVLFYSGMYNEDLIVLGAWMLIGLGAAFVLREENASLVDDSEIPGTVEPPRQRDERPSGPAAPEPPARDVGLAPVS